MCSGFSDFEVCVPPEFIVRKIQGAILEGHVLSLEKARDLGQELGEETVRPLGRTFRVLASKAIDMHKKRRARLVETLKSQDDMLAATLKSSCLGKPLVLQ